MAGRKDMIWQNDFSLGAVRPEAEERDDTDLIAASLFAAENTITLTTGQVERRPGMLFLNTITTKQAFDVSLGAGLSFQLHITPSGFVLYNSDEDIVYSRSDINWLTLGDYGAPAAFENIEFWAVSAPDYSSIIIGSRFFDLRAIKRSVTGVWSFGLVNYSTGSNAAPAVPFYRPANAGNMRAVIASGTTIDLTTDFDFFTAKHIGTYIRHNNTPILITAVTDLRTATGTAKGSISRTLQITVTAGADFSVGDAVEHSTSGGSGLVTGISGNVINVFSLGSYKDFPGSGDLIGPNAKEAISGSTLSVFGALVPLWDAQMFSGVYGYPNWGALHKGRLYLCDYASAPRAFAASQAGDILNFQDGANDADAFVETISGDFGGSLKYIVAAEDLLFLTTRGLYYQPSRDGSAITPLTIGPVVFSQVGVSSIPPRSVEDGCIFVDAVGQQIFAAILSGDAYRSWKAVQLTSYHSHLVKTPRQIGATSFGSEWPEQFIYVVNTDGTAMVCQWDKDQNRISWRPWSTNGQFVSIYQAGKSIYAMVDRTFEGVTTRKREKFDRAMYVDSGSFIFVSPANPTGGNSTVTVPNMTTPASHLVGQTAQVYLEGWDFGDLPISAVGKALTDGQPTVYPSTKNRTLQIGLGFTVRCTPWARRSIQTRTGTRAIKRLIDLYVTVQSTGTLKIGVADYGGYDGAPDYSSPPAMISKEVRIAVSGGAAFKRIPITVDRPGPFRLLKIGYKVSV